MSNFKTTIIALMMAATSLHPAGAHPIAKADAEGALGGAGVGGMFGGPGGAVLGGIIGAAAMSLAEAARAAGSQLGDPRLISVWDPTGGNCGDVFIPRPFGCGGGRTMAGPVFTATTPATDAGYWHNRIVKAYMAENRKFDPAALQRVAIRELSLAPLIAKDPRIKELVAAAADPGVGGKRSPWGSYLTEQASAIVEGKQSVTEKARALGDLERKYLTEQGKDETNRIAIQAYFSVYKHSAAFWNNAQSIAEGNCIIEPSRCGTLPTAIKN